MARPVGNRSERDKHSQENRSRIAVWEIPDRERSVVNRVINAALSKAPPQAGRRQRGVGNSVCNAKRRSRSYHGTGDGKRAQGGLVVGVKWLPLHGPAPRAIALKYG